MLKGRFAREIVASMKADIRDSKKAKYLDECKRVYEELAIVPLEKKIAYYWYCRGVEDFDECTHFMGDKKDYFEAAWTADKMKKIKERRKVRK